MAAEAGGHAALRHTECCDCLTAADAPGRCRRRGLTLGRRSKCRVPGRQVTHGALVQAVCDRLHHTAWAAAARIVLEAAEDVGFRQAGKPGNPVAVGIAPTGFMASPAFLRGTADLAGVAGVVATTRETGHVRIVCSSSGKIHQECGHPPDLIFPPKVWPGRHAGVFEPVFDDPEDFLRWTALADLGKVRRRWKHALHDRICFLPGTAMAGHARCLEMGCPEPDHAFVVEWRDIGRDRPGIDRAFADLRQKPGCDPQMITRSGDVVDTGPDEYGTQSHKQGKHGADDPDRACGRQVSHVHPSVPSFGTAPAPLSPIARSQWAAITRPATI